jgi:hypothetical protein
MTRQNARTTPDMHTNCHARPCPHCRRWTTDELVFLGQHVGKLGLPELTTAMNSEFPQRVAPFTENAVKLTARRKLGRSWRLQGDDLTISDLEQSTGISHRALGQLMQAGFLPAQRRTKARIAIGARQGEWQIHRMDVVHFLELHTWAYDWTTLKEPWREIGRLAWWLTPVVGLDDMLYYVGRKSYTAWKHHSGGIREWAPYLVRHQGAAPWQGNPIFLLANLPRIKQRMPVEQHLRQSAAAKKRGVAHLVEYHKKKKEKPSCL